MARYPRSLVDMGFYHLLSRGNNKNKIFHCQEDYSYFLEVLKRYLGKFQIHVFHYCLMPNHIHLLVQAQVGNHLPKFMQGILQLYVRYYHKKYETVGYLFQSRYRGITIGEEGYLLECARYIERNPLRAGLIRDLVDYPWSSYSFYACGEDDGIIRTANPMYLELSNSEGKRRRIFQEFVSHERPYDLLLDSVLKLE